MSQPLEQKIMDFLRKNHPRAYCVDHLKAVLGDHALQQRIGNRGGLEDQGLVYCKFTDEGVKYWAVTEAGLNPKQQRLF